MSDDVYRSIDLFEAGSYVGQKKHQCINPIEISAPWPDSYSRNIFEPPNYHYHWWCFGINGFYAA